MIGFVTDSASQIPGELAVALGAVVVPVTVNVDGIDHREGVDLSADEFWRRIEGSALPAITTSQLSLIHI